MRGVRRLSTSLASRPRVVSSISAKTGRAPARSTALALETNVNDGQITSWPGPTPRARRASSRAWVPDVVSRTRVAPMRSASSASTRRPTGPSPATRPARASRTASSSRSSNQGAWKAIGAGAGALISAER